MKKRRLSCIFLSLILIVGCVAGCAKHPDESDDPTTPTGNYTVTFDVGEDARAGGVKTPGAQTVMSGSTAVQPSLEYEATSTWWQDYELVSWNKGNTEWNFSTDKVTGDMTLTAAWRTLNTGNVAAEYEANLNWGEAGHLYVHYLKGADDVNEHGKQNTNASAPNYDKQIDSTVYGDWGLWVWEYLPVNSEGRAFYPAWLDESGAVYDIKLDQLYSDAGWDSAVRNNKGLEITYKNTTWVGIQFFSQDSRENGQGFWVNDGGDIYVQLDLAKREKGDYHWFVRQGETQNGTPTYESFVVFDPYEGLDYGSATTKYDVVSHQGANNVYVQQKVAEGWDEDSVGYQIFMASFADSDGDGMGDLRGIIGKLDYLQNLGVDVLWLTPFQQSNSYHGYDVRDYFTVDPRFGTLDDYRELLTEAHKRGMKVLMDFVLNHTSTSNPWFEKSTKLVKETVKLPDGSYRQIDYRNFYTWQNEDYKPKDANEAKQWFKDPNGYYFYSSFNSSMPELNFDYQAVRDAILEVALFWMSFGLDGFRLDAVKHIYMENENPYHSSMIVKDIGPTGDYSFDIKKNEHFFMEFNAKLKASYPSAILVGENFNGDPAKIAMLYRGMDSQFNFNWYYDTTGCLGTMAQAKSSTTVYQYASKVMNQYAAAQFDFGMYRDDYIDGVFTSNHDVQRARDRVLAQRDDSANDWAGDGVRVGTQYEEADVVLSGELAKIYGAMCLTMPGITWIYGGDELGMFGTKKANEDGSEGHEDRWYRQPMKWSKTKSGDSANCEYNIGFNNYVMTWDSLNQKLDGVKEQKQDASSIYSTYARMIDLRKSYLSVFRSGTVTNTTKTFDKGNGVRVVSFEISDGETTFEIFINATQSEVSFPVRPSGTFVYSTNAAYTGDKATINALTYAIFKK